jgi:hypothetical protein
MYAYLSTRVRGSTSALLQWKTESVELAFHILQFTRTRPSYSSTTTPLECDHLLNLPPSSTNTQLDSEDRILKSWPSSF